MMPPISCATPALYRDYARWAIPRRFVSHYFDALLVSRSSITGLQVMFGDVSNLDALARDVAGFRAAGFTWREVDTTRLATAAANDLDALREALARINERVD
jgi:hypothetical protein